MKPALDAFHSAKAAIEGVVLTTISEEIPFVVETDASNHTIAGILNQVGQPVEFFSHSINLNNDIQLLKRRPMLLLNL